MAHFGVLGSIAQPRDRRRAAFLPTVAGVAAALLTAVLFAGPSSIRSASGADTRTRSATRVYFIAADVVRWNYAPAGRNNITGLPFDETAAVFTQRGPQRIGSTYIKSVFRAYTDAAFTRLVHRPPAWQHLGMLGPLIRATVGDRVTVVFRNNLDRPASIHVHGFAYRKSAEGAPYSDGTRGAKKLDDAVPPGGTFAYHYTVPERAGPGPMDGSSIMWMYHSHVDEVADDYAGLVGPIIVTRRGAARPDSRPKDVNREFVLQFKVSDENASPYLQRNIATFAGNPASVDPEDEGFIESNLMHSTNGYVYGNQPLATMRMRVGQRVRFYLMGMGTEVDLHTPHFHGNTVVSMGMRTDVLNLLPASMVVADMVPDSVGVWLLHCHVNDHISAGMITRYEVTR